jgi:alanyl-tRNA synthetase
VAERLYWDSGELEFRATVTDIRLVSRAKPDAAQELAQTQLWQVALDQTVFYPEGGGQPWDTGVLIATARSGAVLEVPVERVEEDDAGEVWHFVRKPLVEGTEVVGRVDADRRMDHAQQHTGQHLLSAIFLRELGARTVSFHLGTESSTIDLARVEALCGDELQRVEATANRLVYEDRAVRTRWVSREEAEAMLERGELRKLPEREGPMRIVEMEGVEFNACGGTHVGSTGAIGGVMVRRLEKVKQGWRVEFCCGLRGVRAARRDFVLLRDVAGMLSVGTPDVPDRVTRLLEERKAAAKELKAAMKAAAGSQSGDLPQARRG